MTRIVVLISGTGSNLKALVQAYGEQIVGVVADRDAPGLQWAKGIATAQVNPADYSSREEWDRALTDTVAQFQPDLIVCAGFMRLVGQTFLAAFAGKVINTHPALLPSFPGMHGVRDALDHGVKITGATIFYVDAGVDTGRIIAQVAVPVRDGDSEETLAARLKEAETAQLVRVVGELSSRV
ncbi:phosphoribosylglycinamide formyltransferase [Winkia neuii]|uniref:phosphoribosylglycinamide formyltransferase n=1 Tax=Winkia TaxID=2692118 RepID=UPI00142FCD78|nr:MULTISPECIES: phosphoribosylglycinamide formyltransferase [Winkia]MDK7185088.1 phosphoribosylglycinamide formyltransferase [Winkia sp. UMB1295B]NJJ16175.1 phosphoribosylglycinamide formyltransferase [Winkia neuii]